MLRRLCTGVFCFWIAASLPGIVPARAAMEPQTSVYCMRDLLKTILVNRHRSERLVRPTQAHILRHAKAFKGASAEEQVEYLVKNVQGLDAQEAEMILKMAYEYPNRAPNARVVFGGSRVRGTARPESDLDLGFFGFGRNQVDKIIKRINSKKEQGLLSIPVETTKIYEMNETPFIPMIRSPEEFFMRSGEGWSSQGKMKDFTPSGFISIGMDGTIVHVPPPAPNVETILSESARSGWVKMYEKRHPGDFHRLLVGNEARYFEPDPAWGGPATRDKQLPKILMDLDQRSVWPEEYRSLFRNLHGRGPSYADHLAYYESRLELYEEAVRAISKRVREQQPGFASNFERHFLAALGELKKRKSRILRGSPDAFERLNSRLSGVLGEMRAALSLENVKELGPHLSSSRVFQPRLDPRLAAAERALSSRPGAFQELAGKYPRVFTPPRVSPDEMVVRLEQSGFREKYFGDLARRFEADPAKGGGRDLLRIQKELSADPSQFRKLHRENPKLFPTHEVPPAEHAAFFSDPEKRKTYLRDLRRFLDSKEIDILLEEPGGRFTWVEVKNNYGTLTREGFHDSSFGKSAAHQLEEDQEILRFLGLEDRVRIRMFVNEIDEPLIQELKTKQVEVTPAFWLK